MKQEKIDRINELARKAKTSRGLSEEERIEQAQLRQEYISSFKANLVQQLSNTYILRPDGTKEKLERKKYEKK